MPRKPESAESLQDIARKYEAMIDDDSMDETLVPIQAQVAKPVGVVYSTRYSSDEIAFIRRAAKTRRMAPTAFIRAAALAAASGDLDLEAADKVVVLQDAQAKARDLVDALQRL